MRTRWCRWALVPPWGHVRATMNLCMATRGNKKGISLCKYEFVWAHSCVGTWFTSQDLWLVNCASAHQSLPCMRTHQCKWIINICCAGVCTFGLHTRSCRAPPGAVYFEAISRVHTPSQACRRLLKAQEHVHIQFFMQNQPVHQHECSPPYPHTCTHACAYTHACTDTADTYTQTSKTHVSS